MLYISRITFNMSILHQVSRALTILSFQYTGENAPPTWDQFSISVKNPINMYLFDFSVNQISVSHFTSIIAASMSIFWLEYKTDMSLYFCFECKPVFKKSPPKILERQSQLYCIFFSNWRHVGLRSNDE